MSGYDADASENYEAARQRVLHARGEWVKLGKPLTHRHSNKTEGAHPALQALLACEPDARRALEALRPARHHGPDPVAVPSVITDMTVRARQ